MSKEQLGTKGYAYYNRLREFYYSADRIKILEYIITYSVEEIIQSGQDPKDNTAFDERVRIRGYTVVKKLYDNCVKRLYEGKDPIELNFPDKDQIRERIKRKYLELDLNLEQKIKDYEEEGENWKEEDDTGKEEE